MNFNLDFIKSIANEKRIKIIFFLAENSPSSVNEISTALKFPQSSTSEHIKILKNMEILSSTRDGNFIFYTLNNLKIGNELDLLASYLKVCC